MPLTPQDVSAKRFTPVRIREGYDMTEVDQFLDEVEAELASLLRENDDLRSQLGLGERTPEDRKAAEKAGEDGEAPTSGESSEGAAGSKDSEVAADEERPEHEGTPDADEQPYPEGDDAHVGHHESPAPTPRETIHVTTAAEASAAATRLLELATQNADQVVEEAQQDAQRIREEARAEAERVESESRARAEALDGETDTRRQELMGALEEERGRLDGEVENLRGFEREYRSRLRDYFHQQLAALDDDVELGEAPGASAGSDRLRSILNRGAGNEGGSGSGSESSSESGESADPASSDQESAPTDRPD